MMELGVGSRQQVPRLKLFCLKSLGDLVLNDGGNAGPDVVEDVTELKLSLEACSRDCSALDKPLCHAVIGLFGGVLKQTILSVF